MKRISKLLQIHSKGYLPALGSAINNCNDSGRMTVPEKYKEEKIDADFLLLISIQKTTYSNFIAYASACALGNLNFG